MTMGSASARRQRRRRGRAPCPRLAAGRSAPPCSRPASSSPAALAPCPSPAAAPTTVTQPPQPRRAQRRMHTHTRCAFTRAGTLPGSCRCAVVDMVTSPHAWRCRGSRTCCIASRMSSTPRVVRKLLPAVGAPEGRLRCAGEPAAARRSNAIAIRSITLRCFRYCHSSTCCRSERASAADRVAVAWSACTARHSQRAHLDVGTACAHRNPRHAVHGHMDSASRDSSPPDRGCCVRRPPHGASSRCQVLESGRSTWGGAGPARAGGCCAA